MYATFLSEMRIFQAVMLSYSLNELQGQGHRRISWENPTTFQLTIFSQNAMLELFCRIGTIGSPCITRFFLNRSNYHVEMY